MRYVVLDLIYTVEEGQECFEGTWEECEEFVKENGNPFTFKIVPIVDNY